MALSDIFRRRKRVQEDQPLPLGESESDYEDGEGGPSFFRQELAELRWAAQQEAVNVGRREIDPTRWDQGRMLFDFERFLAHEHEALRDRLANYVGQQLRDEGAELYTLASDVALARAELEQVDEQLRQESRNWRSKYREVFGDQLDLNRFTRHRSETHRVLKFLVAAVFVIGEFIISGIVFEQLFPNLPQGLGFVLAFGITLALIVIPHYAAYGLKEGITQYHSFRDDGGDPDTLPASARRAEHFEQQDDRGFRWVSGIVGVGLLLLIIPLSVIRARGDGDFSWPAFFFMLLLQYVLSGYFFLREWLDYGQPSVSLSNIEQEVQRLQAVRSAALADLAVALDSFHEEAEDVLFVLQQAPRWDSYIVHTYLATLRYFRHVVVQAQPDLDQFVAKATVPYLGSAASIEASTYPLDPLSNEHVSRDEHNAMGREWWMRTVSDALDPRRDADSADAAAPDRWLDTGWMVTKSPAEMLRYYLRTYFGMEPEYVPPKDLFVVDLDEAAEANDGEESEAAAEPTPTVVHERPRVVPSVLPHLAGGEDLPAASS